jgi:hypothetical protein
VNPTGFNQWQTFSLVKAAALGIKRESPCLQPYHSAGEFNFHRGLGIGLQRKMVDLFYSYRKISSNLQLIQPVRNLYSPLFRPADIIARLLRLLTVTATASLLPEPISVTKAGTFR